MINRYRLYLVCVLVVIFFIAHTSQSIEFPQERELQVCLAYAKKYSDLNAAQQLMTETINSAIKHDLNVVVATDSKLIIVKKMMARFVDRLDKICPGVGYKCERFLSTPKKNNCKPLKIETHHKFVFQIDTYK